MASIVRAVNTLASFLAHEQIREAADINRFLSSCLAPTNPADKSDAPTDVIVLCGSAILSLGEDVFSAISGADPVVKSRNLILVICGGIGHSTSYMYDAVKRHPRYHVLAGDVRGQPEARVFQMIAERWYGLSVLMSPGDVDAAAGEGHGGFLKIIVEDGSTNCGANALESKNVLDVAGVLSPRSIIVVQDATMSRRTVASFEKAYSGLGDALRIVAWPTFVPEVMLKPGVQVDDGDAVEQLVFSDDGATGARKDGLWDMRRFLDLLVGEIPRLRDDENGYGPRGKGFIGHVDVPEEVEEAWRTLTDVLKVTNR
ncbi:hypothetical protein ACHAQH_009159 [Verticillium albo-atrum]